MMRVLAAEHRHSLLVVDSRQHVTNSILDMLGDDDYDIECVTDADEALSKSTNDTPCLLLCDISLPGVDGFELCRRVRQRPDSADLPVALISGAIEDRFFQAAVDAGVADIIEMPFVRAEFRLRVRNLILLHEANSRGRQLFDCATQGILAASVGDRRFVMANAAACDLLGYAVEELLALRVDDIHPRENISNALREFELHGKGARRHAFNWPLLRKDGQILYADITTTLMTMYDIPCAVGFVTDVTERVDYEQRLRDEELQLKTMEAELRHAQKMEAVGRLAAGIAHEINTPTQFVGDNTRFLKDAFRDFSAVLGRCRDLITAVREMGGLEELCSLCDDAISAADIDYLMDEIPRAVDQSLEGVERIARIVRAMKEFAHPGSGEKVYAEINKLVETTATVSKNEWKYIADLALHLDPTLPEVYCLPGEINQVLLNLIVNAAHAVNDASGNHEKGRIDICTKGDGDFAEIRISDTGCGIPEEIRDKIMEPFFTTKEVGRGTGQGLAIARAVVVDKHGGTLTFESKLGEGTTFIIRLPIEEPDALVSSKTL